MRHPSLFLSFCLLLASCSFDTSGVKESRETSCDDGRDNDGDGFVDCADQDCELAAVCNVNNLNNLNNLNNINNTNNINNINNVTNPELCDNDLDDDGDELIDCADPDCAAALHCQTELCNNNVDDDGDGLIDCADPDCATALHCQTELCNNNVDDDGDGLIDCADPTCAAALNCQTEICDNLIDDNGDGRVDCADPTCATALVCRTEICTNTVDDNGNGLIDCADPDCFAALNCQAEICDNLIDDNGNGLIDCAEASCAGHAACAPTACASPGTLTCGGTVNGTTVGGPSVYTQYPGCHNTSSSFTGPERAFRLQAPAGREVTVDVTVNGGSSSDLDVFLIQSTCGTAGCIDASLGGWGAPEQVGYLSDGGVYFVIVDTYNGPGPFTISVTCAASEICDNGVDDNGNGYIDCVDYVCLGGAWSSTCGDCNAITNYGCGGSVPHCEFSRATGYVGRCAASQGTATEGQACNSETDCALGLFCHNSLRVCRALCHKTLNDCSGGRTCVVGTGWPTSTIYGICQ